MHPNLQNLFDLRGKVALVTGGNKGLGKSFARGLAQAGASIFLASRSEEELQASLEEIQAETGCQGGCHVVDVADRDSVRELARVAVERMGKVDILVNNAGMNHPQAIDAVTDDAWDRILEVNLSSVMALTRELVPGMRRRRWGRVVHISSIMGVVSKAQRNGYSATKSALLGLMRASALDVGGDGVTVNCIAPGPFLTDMPMKILSDREKQEFAAMTALDRWGRPDELIGPLLSLVSDAGSYITGHVLVVDGGYTIR